MFIYIRCIPHIFLLMGLCESVFLPPRMLQDLWRRANETMDKYDRTESAISMSSTKLRHGSPSWYLGASHEMTEAAHNLSRQALRSETMAIMLVEALDMSPRDAVSLLPAMSLTPDLCHHTGNVFTRTASQCKKFNPKYRTHTGTCNNPSHPNWGAALEAYSRILPPEYQDGVSLPKTSFPSARQVSMSVHSGGHDSRHPFLMAMTALFGQFVAHDLAHTPKIQFSNGERLKCCDVDFDYFHPECFPIRADSPLGCMEYSRSAIHPGNNQGCKLGPRQQMNQATSYLDLSPIYGSSEETSRSLRSGKTGLLKTQRKNLPMPSANSKDCRTRDKALPCFSSGDYRINEHPGIAMMHVLFLREHNRIAGQLAELNPLWDDERLYQEARRIVIAEMQHITYGEFLPAVLGENNLQRFNLRPMKLGFFTKYDSRLDGTVSNAAASAGLFFIAALTPKTLDLVDSSTSEKSGERSLYSAFYAPQELYEAGAIDRLIAGATAGHSRKPYPPSLNEIFLERYFHDGKTNDAAVDYVAQVIQEGRDHGLPPYIRWRAFCDMPDVKTFKDLSGTMSKDTIDRLQRVYRNVEDIDLVTGALSEVAVEDAVMGPTFLCLLGHTFRNTRLGDRYWYENDRTPGAFTINQLNEIRRSTMAKILCDNGDRLKKVQPRAFLLKDPFLNEMTDCTMYQSGGMNLSVWKEYRN
ncbi:peroxidasin [Fopius arisanus]|uniref:Peroxidasin n=1 Tax=Fopius arisanus TaxID=64838 RepID=A0A0C9R888_9HYME|nr:PREDICTED: peroxidasin-like [Fopius arisanus]